MTDNTLSTETSSDTFSPAEAAYFSSRGEDTSGFDSATPQDGAGNPPANGQATAPADGQRPASGQETAGADPSGEDDGEEVIIVGKDGKPRAQGSGRFVPHQALHKERERRKGIETELLTTREKMARADERLHVLNEILTKADAPEPPTKAAEIDPAVDPIGAVQAAMKKIAELEGKLAERDKQTSERDTVRAMQTAYQNDAVAYMREQPEFKAAYNFLISQRDAELEAMGGYPDKAARDRAIANEERQIVVQALEARKSPSQMLHKLAIARGFKAAPAKPEGAPDPMAKIDAIAKSQQTAGASLSGAGGASGEGMTFETLANMSEAEFDEVSRKLGKAKMRQLMGG